MIYCLQEHNVIAYDTTYLQSTVTESINVQSQSPDHAELSKNKTN